MKLLFLIMTSLIGATGVSNQITLTVNGIPQASGEASIALTGDAVLMTVTPTGAPPFSYQWQKDNGSGFTNISGATGQTLSFSSATAGVWNVQCLVNNNVGQMTSNMVTLTVYWKLAINVQPTWQAKLAGETAQYSVGYTGGVGPVVYQWRKDGTDITDGGNYAGTTSSLLTISNAQVADQGSYSCQITDSYTSVGGPANQVVTSNAGQLTIIASLPTLTLTYNTATPTVMSCSQDSGGTPLEVLCVGNGSWTTANIATMGVRFYNGTYKYLANAVNPTPMTATSTYTFAISDASLTNFNGKIAPYVVIGTNKFLVRDIEVVKLIKDGVTTTLTRSDGNYYDLDLRP